MKTMSTNQTNETETASTSDDLDLSASDLILRGQQLAATHEYKHALDTFRQAARLKRQPMSSQGEAYAWIGVTQLQLQRPRRAQAAFRKAKKLGFVRPIVHWGFGLAAQLRDKDQLARTYLQVALDQDPEYVPALQDLGSLDAKQGNWEAARDWFSRALAVEPDSLDLRLKRAAMHLNLGEFRDALSDLERAYGIQPGNSLTLLLLANVRALLGDFGLAAGCAERLSRTEGATLESDTAERLARVYQGWEQISQLSPDFRTEASQLLQYEHDTRSTVRSYTGLSGLKELKEGFEALVGQRTAEATQGLGRLREVVDLEATRVRSPRPATVSQEDISAQIKERREGLVRLRDDSEAGRAELPLEFIAALEELQEQTEALNELSDAFREVAPLHLAYMQLDLVREMNQMVRKSERRYATRARLWTLYRTLFLASQWLLWLVGALLTVDGLLSALGLDFLDAAKVLGNTSSFQKIGLGLLFFVAGYLLNSQVLKQAERSAFEDVRDALETLLHRRTIAGIQSLATSRILEATVPIPHPGMSFAELLAIVQSPSRVPEIRAAAAYFAYELGTTPEPTSAARLELLLAEPDLTDMGKHYVALILARSGRDIGVRFILQKLASGDDTLEQESLQTLGLVQSAVATESLYVLGEDSRGKHDRTARIADALVAQATEQSTMALSKLASLAISDAQEEGHPYAHPYIRGLGRLDSELAASQLVALLETPGLTENGRTAVILALADCEHPIASAKLRATLEALDEADGLLVFHQLQNASSPATFTVLENIVSAVEQPDWRRWGALDAMVRAKHPSLETLALQLWDQCSEDVEPLMHIWPKPFAVLARIGSKQTLAVIQEQIVAHQQSIDLRVEAVIALSQADSAGSKTLRRIVTDESIDLSSRALASSVLASRGREGADSDLIVAYLADDSHPVWDRRKVFRTIVEASDWLDSRPAAELLAEIAQDDAVSAQLRQDVEDYMAQLALKDAIHGPNRAMLEFLQALGGASGTDEQE
jgi:tetratricopeptide (TPR) repeat protein